MRLCMRVLVARITIETGSVESVVARVDRRFDSSTILRLSVLSFTLTGCDG